MKHTLLLPRHFRIAGLITFPLFLSLLIAVYKFDFLFPFLSTHFRQREGFDGFLNGNNNLTDEMAVAGVLLSMFFIAFSKLKVEDEYIRSIRLQSLQIGVYANYALIILATFLLYNGDYLAVLLYNIFTILVLFILVFNFNLYIKPMLSKSESL